MTIDRGSAVLVGLAALIAGALAWYLGTDVWHAVVIGAGVAAVVFAWRAVPAHGDVAWPDPLGLPPDGGRRDIVHLSWSLRTRYGRVGDTGMRPVRALARRRLAAYRLDLRDPRDGPAIVRLIGKNAYATLCYDGPRGPWLRSVVRCLDALDRLEHPPGKEAS